MSTKKSGEELKNELLEVCRKSARQAAMIMRDHAVKCIRQFGGRMSTEELAQIVERTPILGDDGTTDEN